MHLEKVDRLGALEAQNNPCRCGYKGRTTISKESPDSPRKIDAAVCVIGARMVRRLVLSSKEWQQRQRPKSAGRGWLIGLA